MKNLVIKPSGVTLEIEETLTILESAAAKDVVLEHSCRDGSCGVCKARLVSGEVSDHSRDVLTEEEKQNNFILTCSAKPVTDVEIEAKYFPELEGIKPATIPCKVDEIAHVAGDIIKLKLRFPPTSNFTCLPGQYIQLILQGERRSYSVANLSSQYSGVELFVKNIPGGKFSEFLFNDAKVDQLFRLYGPLGTFFVRDRDVPMIFIGGGTGIAPIRAMVQDLLESEHQQEIIVYWGASTLDGFFTDLAWPEDRVKVHKVYSGPDIESFDGRTGFVHAAMLADIVDLSPYDIYASGAPVMIEAIKESLKEREFDENRMFFDAFLPS